MKDAKWFVVYTKPGWEKKVVDQLGKKGIRAYCPVSGKVPTAFEKKRTDGRPVFECYVFVYLAEESVLELRQVHGMLNFIYWLGQPAVVTNEEIETIKNITSSYSHIRIEKSLVKMQDEVQVVNDTRLYRRGDIVEVKNAAVKVTLPSLGYFLIAESYGEAMTADTSAYQKSISMTKPSL